MLCKSRRSSIALTLLFFFIFSIACCVPVGMAENPPSAGGGGEGGDLIIVGQEPPAISELTANPNTGYLASTVGVSLNEPEGEDIWSETSNIILQLVIPGTPPQTVTEVSFSNIEITENSLFFDINVPANISEGNYAIEVWVNSEVKATAAFQVEDKISGSTRIDISPIQVNTGTALSFEFSLQGINLNYTPYAYVGIPSAQVPPEVVLGEVHLESLGEDWYRASFSSGLTEPGSYVLTILDGSSGGIIRWVAYGNFQAVQPQGDNMDVINLVLSPCDINIGTVPSFKFAVPQEFSMPAEPYGQILQPGESPVPVGNPVLLGTKTIGDEIYYNFYDYEVINEIGNYELHIFDGLPVQGSQPIAIGSFNVVPVFLPLNPPILTAGEQISLAFDIPTNIPAADIRYAMLVEDIPPYQPVSGVTPVAITPASGSDSMWLATWPELQLEPGNYLLAIFNAPPTLDSTPVAFGLFSVNPAFFRLVTEKLPLANVDQLYEATVEVANGTAPYTWEFEVLTGETPFQGMTLVRNEQDTSKAVLSFTPSQPGLLSIIIEVTDSNEETIFRHYNLITLPPLFTLTPNEIIAGDLLNFEFSLPAGVTVNNPYAVLGNLDTGWYSYPEKASCSAGTCQINFSSWMLDSLPSGEYYVGIYEGIPQQRDRALAAGKIDFLELPWLSIEPHQVIMPYSSGQVLSLQESWNESIWNQGDELTLEIFQEEWEQDIPILKEIPAPNNIQVQDDIINFTLPDGLDEGWYQVRVYRGEERIALSFFSASYPRFQVNPSEVPAYFREGPVIELQEDEWEIWNATDILEIRLFSYKDSGCEGSKCVLEATIPNGELIKTDDVIKFNLPDIVDCGYHEVKIFRENNLVGWSDLYIYAPWVRVEPYRLNTDVENKIVQLSINDPETWYVSEADQLRICIEKKNYYGPESCQYNLEYKQTIEPAELTVSEDAISFIFPELETGAYELALQRKINTEFWRTVGWGDFLYAEPPLKLQLAGDVLSGDLPTVKEGYSDDIQFILTDTTGTAWPAGEPLNLNLFYFNLIDNCWNYMPWDLQPYDVVVEEGCINAKLPIGIWAGDYTITVSHANVYPENEFALAQFRVLPILELNPNNLPTAIVNEPYQAIINVTDGEAPYYWSIYTTSPEYQWPAGFEYYSNENDTSQLMITGTFTDPGIYPLEIEVRDNGGKVSYHPVQLVVREGMPRVIAGTAAGLPGREVIVPIMGDNLVGTGVSGIQFNLDYDPAVAAIVDDGILRGTIPNVDIHFNTDNENGRAYIAVAWTQPLPAQINFAEFCRVKFQINSNPADATCIVYLNDVDGTILSHGEYDIPAEVINGTIRATGYGDVNGNGKVDVGDAVLILRHSAGIINLPEALIELADVDGNKDGVGPTDAIQVLKRVVRLIDKFPVEI